MMKRLAQWAVAEGDRSPARIRARVLARPSGAELVVVGSILLIVVLASGGAGSGIDWETYANAADGQMSSTENVGVAYYYAYWLLPIFDLFDIGGVVGQLVWTAANVAGLWFAARVFGARAPVVLAGFGALEGFYTGTITGLAIGALAGVWWALHEERWLVAGALTLLSVAKPQWGVPLTLVMVWQARPGVGALARLAVVPLTAALASLVVYGWWPADVLDRAGDNPPAGNGSGWIVIGAAALLLWVPVALPMTHQRRLALVATTAMLASPYVQQYDFPVVWVLATDGIGLVSHLFGLLRTFLSESATRAVLLVAPLTTYVWLSREPIAELRARRAGFGRGQQQPA